MSCYVFAMKTFNSSFAEVDGMELETLSDLISVYEKISDAPTKKTAFIDDIL